MTLDKRVMKAYRRLLSADSQIQAFQIVDRLSPSDAKRLFITYIMSQPQYTDKQTN